MNKLKIGDRVRVSNYGSVYNSYSQMAEFLGATKWKRTDYADIFDHKTGIIKNIGRHLDGGSTLICLVDLGSQEILISMDGLTRTEPKVYGIVKWLREVNSGRR